jgi:hypothetical protein
MLGDRDREQNTNIAFRTLVSVWSESVSTGGVGVWLDRGGAVEIEQRIGRRWALLFVA